MSKKVQVPAIRERVVIFEQDGYNVDVLPVTGINDNRVLAGDRAIPLQDLKTWISPHGRVYTLNAPEEYINETKHLAMVEMSTVIHQAVNYQRPGAAIKNENPLMKFLPWILVLLVAFLWVIKK